MQPMAAKKPMMGKRMADGGMGAATDDASGGVTDPDNDGDGGVKIDPSAVNYHDDPHSCSGCKYFGQDAQCAVLQMQVSPEGGCTAFAAGSGQSEEDSGDDSNTDQSAMSAGSSGDDDSY
jgi:hypothetical protein